MSIDYSIENSGTDVFMASEMMSLLGLNQYDLEDPVRYRRFQDVIEGFKNNEHYSYIIKKIVTNKNVDKLDHTWGYLQLNKQKEQIITDSKKLDSEISTLINFASEKGNNPVEMNEYKALSEKRSNLMLKAEHIKAEIELYE